MPQNAAAFGSSRLVTPGVYFEEPEPRRAAGFSTGHPVFFGFSASAPAGGVAPGGDVRVAWLTAWEQFAHKVASSPPAGFLAAAVRGFFENGGALCLVVAAPPPRAGAYGKWLEALLNRLDWVEHADDVIDLLCVPDLPAAADVRVPLQQLLLEHCDRVRNRFAILDAAPETDPSDTGAQWHSLVSPNGALYYPWLLVSDGADEPVPPCGHVAGVYARTDRRIGPHKAPANEVIDGAVDVDVPETISAGQHRALVDIGLNRIRSLPGRGIRICGARTLSGRAEWRYINVRRLFITVRRRLEIECRDLVFEGNHQRLWDCIRERLGHYCYVLYQNGALRGSTPDEAYYVKCDAETNPPASRDAGEVTAEIGLAANRPAEFVVVRITRNVVGGTPESSALATREGS